MVKKRQNRRQKKIPGVRIDNDAQLQESQRAAVVTFCCRSTTELHVVLPCRTAELHCRCVVLIFSTTDNGAQLQEKVDFDGISQVSFCRCLAIILLSNFDNRSNCRTTGKRQSLKCRSVVRTSDNDAQLQSASVPSPRI